MTESFLKRSIRRTFARVLRLYFREIEATGEPPTRATQGRIFVANHVNGLVDPALVLTMCDCAISPIAKSTLWDIPGLRWLLDVAEAVPVVRRRDNPEKSATDNDSIFEKIGAHLTRGGNVLIFPEGTSHNEPGVLPLRTGAARMLLRAKNEGATELSFQAVGLEFDARDTFRSRVLVLYGPVRNLRELAGRDDDALIQTMAEQMHADLEALLVTADSWEERVLIARVAALFANEKRDKSLREWNAIGRRVEYARSVLAKSEPSKLTELKDAVREYFARLEIAKTSDELVSGAASSSAASPALSLLWPLAAIGAVLYWLPYQLPRFVATRLRGSPDVVSTYKLGVGLAAYPSWVALLCTLCLWRIPFPYAVAALVLVVVSPWATLLWLDRRDRNRTLGSLPGKEVLVPLQAKRKELLTRLEAASTAIEAPTAQTS
jgi:glycerol-3-phosphate O-acyltransferase / dihydroxyacetone phosphate acyltransferase